MIKFMDLQSLKQNTLQKRMHYQNNYQIEMNQSISELAASKIILRSSTIRTF
ncbi:unnamed protein product [Paramecium pentaurelia]|uniref:Uncharacterized protein n=1 Tax=Paramecium pentaurelia TaxID=43138 RepID=A0A8S1V775_9CILI|nr:unnamed protein product [Paramecium pentaurelia]